MAEIKDVYSLEFDAASFEAQVDSAIAKIDELNASLEDGADVSEVLTQAQEELNNVLQTEAKTTQQLTQKRDVLVKTEKNLNKESQTGVAVNKQLNQTNKQLAVSTGEAAAQQKNLGGQLLQGARNVNSMKRAVGLLRGAFNLLGGLNPFGLIATALPTVISSIGSFFGKTEEATEAVDALQKETESIVGTYQQETAGLDNLFGALNEANKGRGNKAEIIKELNRLYGSYLGNINLETASQAELEIAYRRVARAIADQAVEKEKAKLSAEVQGKILERTIKFYQDITDPLAEATRLIDEQISQAKFLEGGVALRKILEERKAMLKTKEDAFRVIAEFGQKGFLDTPEIIALRDKLKLIEAAASGIGIALSESVKVDKLTGEFKQASDNISKINKDRIISDKDYELQKEKEFLEEEQKFREENDKYLRDLVNKRLEAEYLKSKEYNQKILEDDEKYLTDKSQLRLAVIQTDLNNELIFLEKQRQLDLQNAANTITDQEKLNQELEFINERYDAQRRRKEIESAKEAAKVQLQVLKELFKEAVALGLDTTDLKKKISDIELQLTELDKVDYKIDIKTGTDTEKTKKDLKEIKDQVFSLVQEGSDAVFSVLTAQTQAYISALDKAADRSRSTLDEIRQNSENFNARQLELEKKRLEELEQQRREAVEREKAIALVQLVVNSTLAIAKAAAESPAIAPFAIASTIIALIAGFAQARAAAGSAFYEGSEYIDRENRFPAGRDTVPARLNKGERVITTDTNSKYWDVLTAVHNKKIPADVLNGFANNYLNGGLKNSLLGMGTDVNLNSELGGKSFFINMNTDNNRLESRLENIENILSDLPKYMPSTTVMANANGIFKVVETRQRKANFNRNRSK
jgi:hypothetical protein